VNSGRLRAPAFVLLGTIFVVVPLVGASAAAPEPSISVSPGESAPGETVVVRLDNWPATTANVSVCGNQANRGSQDCDLRGAQGVGITGSGPTFLSFPLTVPPVGCPCVIRAESPTGDLVRTTTIELAGVPVVPPLPAVGPGAATQLQVKTKVLDEGASWPRSWLAPFGGPVTRTLSITLRNMGTTPLSGMRVVAFVGRDRSSGEPVASAPVSALAPQTAETLEFPVEISAPTWGTYVVYGTVYGLDVPVSFTARTETTPWAWQVMLPLALLVVARILRRRDRARARPRAESAVAPVTLSQSSPDVVSLDEGRYSGSVYDPAQRPEHAESDLAGVRT
jgi:hypothetical protein